MNAMLVVSMDPKSGLFAAPSYKQVFAYVLRTMSADDMIKYLADRNYSLLENDFDMAAVVAYDLSNEAYAEYRELATGMITEAVLRERLAALLPGSDWNPSMGDLAEAGSVM